ncbi:MAG: hypothetical protein AB1730_28435 [Myxococcota bacterium]
MRRALATFLIAALAGCGGLENVPLMKGVVRGALVGADAHAMVAVVDEPGLSARPEADGTFVVKDVPHGDVELLLIVNVSAAERRTVRVTGGGVADVGNVAGRPAGTVELHFRLPDLLSPRAGSASVHGTAITQPVDKYGETALTLPAGCYLVRGEVPGVPAVERSVCALEGVSLELELDFPRPNGSPGQEGCSVSGCEDGAVCKADGRCVRP